MEKKIGHFIGSAAGRALRPVLSGAIGYVSGLTADYFFHDAAASLAIMVGSDPAKLGFAEIGLLLGFVYAFTDAKKDENSK
ncbi:hypothetical protein [Pseudovibrio exalbescens]|uniref:hypothetical protein n=1 Tax=Pseudovibrio exalbescens TaxID=197461 RepID=UPI000C9AD9DB|nr:hypothetical protein [Pseudovibrio exalbescens]